MKNQSTRTIDPKPKHPVAKDGVNPQLPRTAARLQPKQQQRAVKK